MYDYGYDYGYTDYDSTETMLSGLAAMMGVMSIVGIAFSVLMIISLWKIFKKAGKNGWEAIIPIYNFVVLLQIVELPIWYIVLFIVPFANIYAMFKIYIELAHKFGKSTGFGVLTAFFSFICLPILAFGKNNVYNGNNNSTNNNMQPAPSQYTPNNTTEYQNQPTTMNNSMNQINLNAQTQPQQPVMFNQNINTEITPIPSTQNVEPQINNPMDQSNSVQQPNQFGQVTPNLNFQPEQTLQTSPVTPNTTPSNPQDPVNGMTGTVNQQQAILNQNNNNPFNQNI